MAVDLSNFSIIKDLQEESSRVSALIFINGINNNASLNFDSTLVNAIDSSQTTILVVGNYGGYTGNIIIQSEILDVTLAVNVGNNTLFMVTRSNDTTPLSHLINSKVYSVQFMDETTSYDYEMKCDVSDTDLFGVNVESNSVRILAEYLDWANYSSSKLYDYKNSAKIFILEGINDQYIKTYEGYTSDKNPSALEGYVDIEFKNELDRVFESDIRKVKTYKNKYIGEILEDYYPEYTTEYMHMDKGETDTLQIQYINTGDYDQDSTFLKALSRMSACRLRFAMDGKIKLFSEMYPKNITPYIYGDIEENLMEINQQGNDLLIINNPVGTYYEKYTYEDPNNFNSAISGSDYVKFANSKDFTTSITLVVVSATDVATGSITYKFDAIDFQLDANEYTKLAYQDYVVLLDNDSGREFWGKVIDKTSASLITIQFGFDKLSEINYDGRLEYEVGLGTTFTDYTLYYVKTELPIVWKRSRNQNDEDTTQTLKEPICPTVLGTSTTSFTIDSTDDTIITLVGDYTDIGKYAKLDTEYIYIESSIYDGVNTEMYVIREKINTTLVASPTNFTPVKYINMVELSDSFQFVDVNDGVYSGSIEDADVILDNWLDNTTLKYNKEFSQNFPVYLYSNTTFEKSLSKNSATLIKYSGYNNENINVLFESSSDSDNDFNVKIKNTNTEIDFSSFTERTPVNVAGSQIEVADVNVFNAITSGDAIALADIDSTDDRYYTYLQFIEFKWLVKNKFENSGKYYITLDYTYPVNVDAVEFNFIVYTDIVVLQELSIRGNPIMQSEQTIDDSDAPSITAYGKRSYDITNNGLSLENFKIYLDHLEGNYKATSDSNTKSKIPFSTVCRMDLEVLDVITLSDSVVTGLDNQEAVIIEKKVQNVEGKRSESYVAITLGTYTAKANNIDLSRRNYYNTSTVQTYGISDVPTNGEQENSNLVEGSIVTFTDRTLGRVSLLEVSTSDFTGYVDEYTQDGETDAGLITIRNLTAGVAQYNRILTTAGLEGFIKIRGEFISYKCETTDLELQILNRGAFNTQQSVINVDDTIQFFQIVERITTEGLYTTSVNMGDSSSYFKFNLALGAQFKGDFEIISGTGFTQIYKGGDKTSTTTIPSGLISINATDILIGNNYTIRTVGTTDFTLIGASANTIGVSFTAIGIGVGTGTVVRKITEGDLWVPATLSSITNFPAVSYRWSGSAWEEFSTDNTTDVQYTGVYVGSQANNSNGGFEVDTNAEARIHNGLNDLYFKTGSNDSYLKMNYDGSYYQQQIGSGLEDSVENSGTTGTFKGFLFGDPTISNKNFFKYNQDDGSSMFAGKYFNETAYVDTKEELISALDITKATDGFGGTNTFKFVNDHSLKVTKVVVSGALNISTMVSTHFRTANEILVNSDVELITSNGTSVSIIATGLYLDLSNSYKTLEGVDIKGIGDGTSSMILGTNGNIRNMSINDANGRIYGTLSTIAFFDDKNPKVSNVHINNSGLSYAGRIFENLWFINDVTLFDGGGSGDFTLFYNCRYANNVSAIWSSNTEDKRMFDTCADISGATSFNSSSLEYMFLSCVNVSRYAYTEGGRSTSYLAYSCDNLSNGIIYGTGVYSASFYDCDNVDNVKNYSTTKSIRLTNCNYISNVIDRDTTNTVLSVITKDKNNSWNGTWYTKTATGNVAVHEDRVEATTALITLTLDATQVGREYTFANTSAGSITIAFSTGSLAFGSTTILTNTVSKFEYDGTQWYRLV